MDHLFVYGTLRSAARDVMGAAMRARLSREARCVGAATSPGRLYDLGDYPGMIAAEPRERDVVLGELVEIRNTAATFRWLDLYEDVDLVHPTNGLYRRAPQIALLGDGRIMRCWAYVLNVEPHKRDLIASACWLTHCAERQM